MDIGELKALGTVLAMIAFFGIVWWTFTPKNKKRFEEDANLVFDDQPNTVSSQSTTESNRESD